MLPEPLICGNWLDLVIPRLARASSTRATASCKSKFWARAIRIRACSCSSLNTSNHFRSPSEAGSVAVAASAPRNTAGTLEAGLLYLGPTVHPVSIEAIRSPVIKYLVLILKSLGAGEMGRVRSPAHTGQFIRCLRHPKTKVNSLKSKSRKLPKAKTCKLFQSAVAGEGASPPLGTGPRLRSAPENLSTT